MLPTSPVDFTTPRTSHVEVTSSSESGDTSQQGKSSTEESEEPIAAPDTEEDTSDESEDMADQGQQEPQAVAPAPLEPRYERTPEMKLKMPPEFEGKQGEVVEWLQKCMLYLSIDEAAYNTDQKKIIFCLMLMNGGTSRAWARSFIEDTQAQAAKQGLGTPLNWGTWQDFSKQLTEAFDDVDAQASARVLLRSVRQGKRPVEEYITEFKSLISRCGITDYRIIADFFYEGLNRPLREKIFGMYPMPNDTNTLYTRAATLEQQWLLSKTYNGKGKTAYNPTYKPRQHRTRERDPDAMDVDRMLPEEREKHYKEGQCFNCHQVGHLARQCPLKKGKNGDQKGKMKAQITEVAEEEDSDDDSKSTSTRASNSSKKLIAARIRLALKDLDDKEDHKDVVSDLLDEGF